jgi:hypothetical protein
MFQFFKKFWEDNWTKWWGYFKISIGGVFIALQPALNSPDVKDYVHQMNLPLWVGLGLALLGTITIVSMDHKN